MKKLTKKQQEALEYLILDLDELSNKPRRLFSSFEKVVLAFIEEDRQAEILADINRWEEMYYQNINDTDLLEEVGDTARRVRKELEINTPCYYEKEEREKGAYLQGVKDATKKMAIKLNEKIIEDLY